MNWFRVYHDIIDDPKILALPRVYRWHVIELLAVSSRQAERGTIPRPSELSIHLRVSIKKVEEILKVLIDHKFVDANEDWSILKIHGWQNRQFKSDDISPRSKAAMQRSRERSSEPLVNVHVNVTDTETDTETENPPSIPPRGKRRKIESFDPPDWIPSSTWSEFLAMRVRVKKPATPFAQKLVVAELIKLKTEGNDPIAVLEQSIRCNYQDVYPIKQPFNTNGKPSDQPKLKPKPIVTPEEEERINARFK